MISIRPWLLVGKYREMQDEFRLQQRDVKAVLELVGPVKLPGIIALYLPVEDGEPLPFAKLKRGVEFVRLEKALGRNVLIACGAGISRSVAFTIAALKEEESLGLLDAFMEVRRRHAEAMPHPELWKSLCQYYREDIPFVQLLALI